MSDAQKGIYLWPCTYMQYKREIPEIVNDKIVIKCWYVQTFGRGCLTCNGSGKQPNRSACLGQIFILDG